MIEILRDYGEIYITSERALGADLEPYRININPMDIHHIMGFASLYIGDSQTMAAEAAVLGVPFIRFNDFVDRIGYLNELEKTYGLGFGINTANQDRLYQKIYELVGLDSRKEIFQERRKKMLSEKIDFLKFLVWFLTSYPDSIVELNQNPEIQMSFK